MANKADDNGEILDIIKQRMEVGLERYGHGLRTADDTRQWGTAEDSWEEMALEEALDGMIYLAASILRITRARKKRLKGEDEVSRDTN
jgi:hypothetical protein